MDTIIKIGGREAVPVRALPWMTDWHFGAQDVAESLAHVADPAFLDVHSFRLEGSELVKVLAASWLETFLPDVESIENLELPGDEYRERVTRSLPEGVFVWLDEWSAAYERCPDGPGALRILLDDGEPHGEHGMNPEDRSDLEQRLIVRSPRIPSGLAEVVLGGPDGLAKIRADGVVEMISNSPEMRLAKPVGRILREVAEALGHPTQGGAFEGITDRAPGSHVEPEPMPLTHAPGSSAEPAVPATVADPVTPKADDDAPSGVGGPVPLTTRDIAEALDGIESRDADGWRALLGDATRKAKWATPARVEAGTRTGARARWNPLELAKILIGRGVKRERIDRAFRERGALAEWRMEWRREQAAFRAQGRDYGLD